MEYKNGVEHQRMRIKHREIDESETEHSSENTDDLESDVHLHLSVYCKRMWLPAGDRILELQVVAQKSGAVAEATPQERPKKFNTKIHGRVHHHPQTATSW